jgi:hypothetical protein
MKSKYNKTKKKSYSHTGTNKIKKISKKTKRISIKTKTKLKARSKRGGGFFEKLGTGIKARLFRINSAKAKYASILAKEEAAATKAALDKAKELQSKVSSLGSKLGNHIHTNGTPLLAHLKAKRDAKIEMDSVKSALDAAKQKLIASPGADNIAMSVVTAQKALKAKSKAYEAAEKAAVEAEKLMKKARDKTQAKLEAELNKAKTKLFKEGQIDRNTTKKVLASVSSTPKATLGQQIQKHESNELLKLVKAGELTREEKLRKLRLGRPAAFSEEIKKEKIRLTAKNDQVAIQALEQKEKEYLPKIPLFSTSGANVAAKRRRKEVLQKLGYMENAPPPTPLTIINPHTTSTPARAPVSTLVEHSPREITISRPVSPDKITLSPITNKVKKQEQQAAKAYASKVDKEFKAARAASAANTNFLPNPVPNATLHRPSSPQPNPHSGYLTVGTEVLPVSSARTLQKRSVTAKPLEPPYNLAAPSPASAASAAHAPPLRRQTSVTAHMEDAYNIGTLPSKSELSGATFSSPSSQFIVKPGKSHGSHVASVVNQLEKK